MTSSANQTQFETLQAKLHRLSREMQATRQELASCQSDISLGSQEQSNLSPECPSPNAARPLCTTPSRASNLSRNSPGGSLQEHNIPITPIYRSEVRRVYEKLLKKGIIQAFKASLGDKFTDPCNADIVEKVRTEYKNLYGRRRAQNVDRVMKAYWKTCQTKERLQRQGRLDGSRDSNRIRYYLRRKCELRERALNTMVWSEGKKARARSIMTPDYMSDEEPYIEDGNRRRKIIPIPWESTELKNMKQELDQVIPDILSHKEKETRIPTIRTETPNDKSIPKGAPSWCLL